MIRYKPLQSKFHFHENVQIANQVGWCILFAQAEFFERYCCSVLSIDSSQRANDMYRLKLCKGKVQENTLSHANPSQGASLISRQTQLNYSYNAIKYLVNLFDSYSRINGQTHHSIILCIVASTARYCPPYIYWTCMCYVMSIKMESFLAYHRKSEIYLSNLDALGTAYSRHEFSIFGPHCPCLWTFW